MIMLSTKDGDRTTQTKQAIASISPVMTYAAAPERRAAASTLLVILIFVVVRVGMAILPAVHWDQFVR